MFWMSRMGFPACQPNDFEDCRLALNKGGIMEITIDQVTRDRDRAALFRIRKQIFEREMGIALEPLSALDSLTSIHLLARVGLDGNAVAALSVVDTSGNQELHERYRLKFNAGSRVARYTQLAVLRSHRGLNIPLMLMLEAHRLYVAPNRF